MALSCTRVQDMMLDWIHQELPVEVMRELESHIDRCPRCQQQYEELLSLTSELFALRDPDPPSDLPQQIRATIEHELERSRSARALWDRLLQRLAPWPRLVAFRVLPAFLILIAAAWLSYQMFSPKPTPTVSEKQDLVLHLQAGVKRVTLGGLKRQMLQIRSVPQELPDAGTDVWGQPLGATDHWASPGEASSSGSE